MTDLLAKLYDRLAPKRRAMLVVTAVVLCACGIVFSQLVVREDIRTMLPDGSSQVASDFELLRHAPFTQRMIITVAWPDGDPAQAASVLADALRGEVFPGVITGPPDSVSPEFLTRLLDIAPAVLTAEDMAMLEDYVQPEHARAALDRNYRSLIAPRGLALKEVIRKDPLEIRNLVLPKLAALSRLAEVRVDRGHFVSKDGKHALVLAETAIPMTDSQGAADVMAQYEKALKSLPPGAEAILVSGHRHTLANADVIKADLLAILPVSLVLMGGIFLFFMRTKESLYVFLMPVCAVCVAGVLTIVFYGSVSGIVVGFGGVLLGIAGDFALHVSHAMHHPNEAEGRTRARTLAEVAQPTLFGAMTTSTAFAALALSSIPGIRQLAVFSLAGLAAALVLSLVVLPHFVSQARHLEPAPLREGPSPSPNLFRTLLAWALVIGAGFWSGSHVGMNTDLRALGYTPAEVRQDEDRTRSIWGGMREMALVFARGDSEAQALEANDRVWTALRGAEGVGSPVSLSPLLPSARVQAENAERWKAFWSAHGQPVLQTIAGERRAYGFSETAFEPFTGYLAEQPRMVTASTLQDFGLGNLLRMLMPQVGSERVVLTLLPDSQRLLEVFTPEMERDTNSRLVSGIRFRALLGDAMSRDVLLLSTVAFVAVSCITVFIFRDARKALLALLPVGAGVAAVITTLSLAGIAMNIFHILAIPLVISLSVDNGIFMVWRHNARFTTGTSHAVLLCGLTTIAEFGVLTIAKHPALFSIGLTVLVGIATAMFTSLLVIPRLEDDA